MPATSKDRNTRGIEINFNEANHKYWSIINGKEIVYTSGTTFVNKFLPKFDPDGSILKQSAAKQGVTPYELQKTWNENKRQSAKYGTRIHESMEDMMLGRKLRNKPMDDREKIVFNVARKAADKLLERLDILGIEKIIFDEDLKLAGTIDLLARSRKDGSIYILDYKTNKDLGIDNKWRKFGLPPIEHIADTNYGHYMMQLNLYRYLLMKSGYVDKSETVNMALIHITEQRTQTHLIDEKETEIKNMIKIFNGL